MEMSSATTAYCINVYGLAPPLKSTSANFAPSGLPRVAPIAMTGKRRSPVGLSKRAFPDDQNCAITALLKMPTQMKNAMQMYGRFILPARQDSCRLDMKKSETPSSSLIRVTRDANQL